MSPVIFPIALLAKEKEEDVIIFLQRLPVTPRRKKQALIEWCRLVGAALTHELVEKVLGPLEERAR